MSTALGMCPRATDHCCPPASPSFERSTPTSQQSYLPPKVAAAAGASALSSTTPPSPRSATRLRQPQASGSSAHSPDTLARRPGAFGVHDNAARNYTSASHDFEYYQRMRPHLTPSPNFGGDYPVTLPPPSLPLPSIATSAQPLQLAQQLPPLPLPPPVAQGAVNLRRLSSSQSAGSRPHTSNSNLGLSLVDSRLQFPASRRSSSNEILSNLPETTHSRKSSQASIQTKTGEMEDRKPGAAKTKSADTRERRLSASQSQSTRQTERSAGKPHSAASVAPSAAAAAVIAAAAPPKSRRVRTGCLTCRERHLKCDEGLPDCLNCRKGNRECKRGLRLNFIDIRTEPIPFIPAVKEWNGE